MKFQTGSNLVVETITSGGELSQPLLLVYSLEDRLGEREAISLYLHEVGDLVDALTEAAAFLAVEESGIPLEVKISALEWLKAHGPDSGRDWMDHAQKTFTKPTYTRNELSVAWEVVKAEL